MDPSRPAASSLPAHGGELTEFLNEMARGCAEAGEALMPIVYRELRVIAATHLRKQRGERALQPTELVNETFLRLFGGDGAGWNNRHQFFALAAKAMRCLLVDHARRARRLKRGDGRMALALDNALTPAGEREVDTLDMDLALKELGRLNERQARVVELRYFGGLEIHEIATAMGVSKSTIEREWRFARAWLGHRMVSYRGRRASGTASDRAGRALPPDDRPPQPRGAALEVRGVGRRRQEVDEQLAVSRTD